MLFHVTFHWKAGVTTEDQASTIKIFADWSPPDGFAIERFVVGADGTGFLIVSAESAEALYRTTSIWAGAYIDYEVVPVVEIEKSIEILSEGLAFRAEHK